MKTFAFVISSIFMLPGLAVAQQAINNLSPAVNDVNSDGDYSVAEVRSAYPDVTYAEMDLADENDDTIVTGPELLEAVGNGVFAE